MPRVSVIIPTYNRAQLVRGAIESIREQTFQDFEIIVVDDGSTDDTKAVIESIQDRRIRYTYQPNQGPDAARNHGIHLAKGSYIAFLDADDRFLSDKLALQSQALDRQPQIGLVAGGHRYVDEADQPLAERRPWQTRPQLDLTTLLYSCPMTINSILVRRAWLIRAGGFDPAMQGQAEDWDLWLRLAQLGCKMAWTRFVVCTYRMHPGQRVRDGHRQKESMLALIDKFFAQSDLPEEISQQRSQIYAAAFVTGAFREYSANQAAAARQTLSRAIELEPNLIKGNISPLASALISWAADPMSGDPIPVIEQALNGLPDSAAHLSLLKQRLFYAAIIRANVEANSVGNTALAKQYLTDAANQGCSINDNLSVAIELLVDCIQGEKPKDQIKNMETFFDNLPHELSAFRSFRRKALSRLYMANGFTAHRAGAAKEARQFLWQGVRLDHSWLLNRGVWKIMLKALTG